MGNDWSHELIGILGYGQIEGVSWSTGWGRPTKGRPMRFPMMLKDGGILDASRCIFECGHVMVVPMSHLIGKEMVFCPECEKFGAPGGPQNPQPGHLSAPE